MRAGQRLVRLYPGAFRQAWGPDLEADVAAAGRRAWTGVVIGIADIWLHPAMWPARHPGERRSRAAAWAVAVGLAGWLAAHAVLEQDGLLPVAVTHAPVLDAAALLATAGLVLVAPRPRTITTVCRRAARRLAAPTVLGAVVVVAANLGGDAPAPPVRGVLLACWWVALALGAAQVARTVGTLDGTAVHPPAPRRLRAGFGALAASLVVAGAVLLAATVTGGFRDVLPAAVGAALLLVALALAGTLRDLHATDRPRRGR